MYENIVIDDTSVYEIDEQCIKCIKYEKYVDNKKDGDVIIHTLEENPNDQLIVFEYLE